MSASGAAGPASGGSAAPPRASLPAREAAAKAAAARSSLLQIGPFGLVLLIFFLVPLGTLLAVSFFESDMIFGMRAALSPESYIELFTTWNTLWLYLGTLKFAAIVWAITLLVGFTIAYFLVFHVRSLLIAIGLFLLCTVPFWTSNIIRMISWIPLLGKQGLINQAVMALGIADEPIDWLLFSDFSVVVSYVHLFTLFMIVPIFNSMARIDRALIEAARDAGAGPLRIVWEVIVPLSRSGIALGSVFVIVLVMGDFFVVKVMSGGQSASVVSAIFEDINVLLYPSAAASSVVLLLVVVFMVMGVLRVVDIRKELAG